MSVPPKSIFTRGTPVQHVASIFPLSNQIFCPLEGFRMHTIPGVFHLFSIFSTLPPLSTFSIRPPSPLFHLDLWVAGGARDLAPAPRELRPPAPAPLGPQATRANQRAAPRPKEKARRGSSKNSAGAVLGFRRRCGKTQICKNCGIPQGIGQLIATPYGHVRRRCILLFGGLLFWSRQGRLAGSCPFSAPVSRS